MQETAKSEQDLAQEVVRLRARLAEYETRFDRLIELVPDAVVITDANDEIRYVNAEAVRLAGAADAEELLGRSVFDFVFPDDVAPARVGEEWLRQAQRPAHGTLRILQLGGQAVPVEAAAVPIMYEGEEALLSRARDLSGRRHLEQALSDTQDLFYHVFRIVPAALVICRLRDDVLLDVNDEFLAISGYAREEVIGARLSELGVLDEREIARVMATLDGEAARPELQLTVRRKDGTPRTVLATVRRIHVRSEPCLLGVWLDVTERERAAASEKTSRNLFRKIFETSPAAITISSMKDGRVLEANDATVRMSGFERDEIIGRPMAQDWVNPEDRRRLIEQLQAGEAVENVTVAVYDRHGQEKVYEGSFQPLTVRGEPCLLSVVLDVTEQRKAKDALDEREATLRRFYDTVSQMMGVVEIHDGDILHVSDSAASAAFYGTTPEAMRHRRARELGRPPEEIARWIKGFHESKQRGEPVLFTYLHERGDEEPRWLTATLAHVQTLPDGTDRFSYVVSDITEQKHTEQRLIEAKERAEAIAHLRSAILNNITHEVRTPLTVIVGFTSMLRKGVRPEYQRFVDLIERSGNRLMLMLDTILDLAQLEAGTFDVTPKDIDVIALIHEVMMPLRSLAEEKGLTLEPPALDQRLDACLDRRLFGRVLTNLIDNAIKFTEEGRIEIDAHADGDRLFVTVRDTGVGIDAEYLDRIFDEFSQESTGLERSHQGSGLGLAVTQRLVELAGGSIRVESNKGEGSLFTIELPRYDDR